MKLQVAFDVMSLEEMESRLDKMVNYIDIIEVGTPMIIKEGQKLVKYFSEKYPDKVILSDTKIMDGGALETKYALDAGASIVTVCACAENATIEEALKETKKAGKELLVDLIGVKDLEERAKYLDDLGVDYICVHTASDVQSKENNPLNDLTRVKQVVKKAKVSCAGGINLNTLGSIMSLGPDVVIVGSAIHNNDDPYHTCKTMYQLISL